MSELQAKLESFDPASLETLAPRPLLMQGAGLLAVGDVSNLRWVGNDQINVTFPNRLASTVLRLRLIGDKIGGECDCPVPQPCQHFLASMMLCMNLMKGHGAFGRLPNRVLAEELKAELLRKSGSMPSPQEPEQQTTRHVRIRPGDSTIFSYRDAFSHPAANAHATIPTDVRPFCAGWNSTISREATFWEWFTSLARKIRVLVEIGDDVVAVKPGEVDRWQGAAVLDLNPDGLVLRRRLLRGGTPVESAFVPIGSGLVCFPESKTLIRLPLTESWHQWDSIVNALNPSHFGFMGLGKPSVAAEKDLPIELDVWNDANIKWWGTGRDAAAFPTLMWQGQPQQPADVVAQACIQLAPSDDPRLMSVAVLISIKDIEVPCEQALHIEDALSMMGRDSSLFSAKSRRSAIMATLYECWLEDDPKERRALLRALEDAPVFKAPAQRKAAVRLVKEALKAIGEGDSSMLTASAEDGWFTISNIARAGLKAVALARGILGGIWADEVLDFDGDPYKESNLVAYLDKGLPRMPELLALCQKHGVKLTYAAHEIQLMPVHCSVTVREGESLDWFEMKPEVRSGNQLIPQDQWERILTNGHLIDEETGAMKIIDVKSMDGLKRLQHLLGKQKAETGKKEAKGTTLEDLVKIPRMRVLDWLILSKYGIECELPESERKVLESLMSFESLQRETVPPTIKATLRDYQVAGYSWMAFLYRHGFGACLADDMGLGKTLQTITLLAAIQDGTVKGLGGDSAEKRPHLLVVPPTLLFNWENEVKVFCPQLKVYEYTGKGRSLVGIKDGIVITTYDIARRDIETLRNTQFDCVIFDEAQNVKNLGGERSRAMRQLEGRFKLVLTGTPMENHVGEYYSIIDLAVPGLFGDFKTFMDAMKQPNGIFNPLDRARPFVLRRTKDKILKELPPKVTSDMHLELSEEQKRFYTRAVGEVRQEVLAAFEDKSAQQAGIVALAALTRLRQICVSPALIDPEHTEVSPKLQYLIDKIEELREEGHCALVFSQFTKALDQLQKHLKEANIGFLRLDGSTPQQKRKELVESFQSGKSANIFLISLKAGGAGLNLTRASYVFHLDPWWNPAVENQASDRAHRMGQKSTVFIQRLLMLHTVEEKIMQLKARKSELFDRVLSGAEGERATGAVITKEDFKFLLE